MENARITFGPPQKVSYLQARDPSILSWNKMQQAREHVKHNLEPDFTEDSSGQDNLGEKLYNHGHDCISMHPEKRNSPKKLEVQLIISDDKVIKVYLRIKRAPDFSNLYEVEDNCLISKIPEDSYANRNGDQSWKKYEFTKIFGSDTSQGELFDNVVKPKILQFINGENSTLMAYGASGAGKTFTMVGTEDQPGLIPRALEYLFKTLPRLADEPDVKITSHHKVILLNAQSREFERKNTQNLLQKGHAIEEYKMQVQTYKAMQNRLSNNPFGEISGQAELLGVWVSFAEIYNELVYDLLQQPPPRGQTRQNLKLGGHSGETFIKGLHPFYVKSSLEAYSVLQYGLQNLKYAGTALNAHSSRSHSIFSIILVQGSQRDPNNAIISTFNFCDLAGSERLKKTHNVGSRLKESNNINTSLLVLGRCITTIREGQQNKENNQIPPFRESKLTQLFQKALSGQEDIMLMININPCKDMFEETQHVLNFSSVAKKIEKEEKPKRILGAINEYSEDSEALREQLADLSRQLVDYHFFTNLSASLTLEVSELREDHERLLDELAEKDLKLEQLRLEWSQRYEESLEVERSHILNHLNPVIDTLEKKVEELREKLDESKKENKRLQEVINKLKRCPVSSSEDEEDYDSDVIVVDSNTSTSEQDQLDTSTSNEHTE